MKQKKTALIAGASGLIGNELLHYLLEGAEYDRVTAIVRVPLNITHPKLEEKIISFDEMDHDKELFAVDDVFCCLGTTIKKAKTKEAMYKIDVEYPVQMAQLASEKGAKKFLIVSSLNANPHSSIWYPKMKGQLEEKINQIPFQSIAIMQPSLLLGDRDEFRLGEKAGEIFFTFFACLFIGPLKKYKAIQGRTVSLAMYRIAQMNKTGIHIYPSEQIEQAASN
ncbi:NAD-dependent epimerase/dehydratase family protein [Bacillus tuaregi]|uniref:NAD-dependent epimerase/dehydratase family protein n=1 Tax=Bacillus tuaregi TaxID=1816695 RepID=UPI0008F92DEE|nr:NAD-dependent epimerase/dehydratase family protein [Bacillus tuaregi]